MAKDPLVGIFLQTVFPVPGWYLRDMGLAGWKAHLDWARSLGFNACMFASHVQFRQERGDLLLVNNWVNFHRRYELEDHEDLRLRRHLLRIWLAVPNSRPLNPVFIDNYGATGAGEIRGGMQP